jgi:diacylglycerol kinase family enzyme
MVGIGFDGQVVQGIRPGPMKAARMGLAAVGTILRLRLPALSVNIDDVPVPGPVYSVIVANTRNYGGWFAACPAAKPDDGLLDALMLRRNDRRALIRTGAAIVRRREAPRHVVAYEQGHTIEITSLNGREAPVQADGDPCGTTPIRLSVRYRAAAIITPAHTNSP